MRFHTGSHITSTPRSIHFLVLVCYLLVGYIVPLGVRSSAPPDSEIVRQKKGRTIPKSMSVSPVWKIVKHVPSEQKLTHPDLNSTVRTDDPQYDWHGEYLDEAFIVALIHARSPLNRDLRAPPVI